ncbi:unnamed protein product [Brassica rapa subsp. narinosa]
MSASWWYPRIVYRNFHYFAAFSFKFNNGGKRLCEVNFYLDMRNSQANHILIAFKGGVAEECSDDH